MLRPSIIIIYDELEADHAAEWSWLLHNYNGFTMDAKTQTVFAENETAKAQVTLFSSSDIQLNVSDQFSVPVDNWTNKINEDVVIFDIGAFNGNTALKYKKLFPLSRIYSFEPFPESFSELVKNTSAYKDIIPINKGLGEHEGVSNFNSNSFAATNSILNTHESGSKVWGNGLLETLETIKVELTTIDSFVNTCDIKNIDILKMDVQGAEYMVIKGAKETLKKGIVKIIYTEIITLPTYEGQLDFDEMINLMKSVGFKLYHFYNPLLTKEGELAQVDAIFIKSTPHNKK